MCWEIILNNLWSLRLHMVWSQSITFNLRVEILHISVYVSLVESIWRRLAPSVSMNEELQKICQGCNWLFWKSIWKNSWSQLWELNYVRSTWCCRKDFPHLVSAWLNSVAQNQSKLCSQPPSSCIVEQMSVSTPLKSPRVSINFVVTRLRRTAFLVTICDRG